MIGRHVPDDWRHRADARHALDRQHGHQHEQPGRSRQFLGQRGVERAAGELTDIRFAAHGVEVGIDPPAIARSIFDGSLGRLTLLGAVLN